MTATDLSTPAPAVAAPGDPQTRRAGRAGSRVWRLARVRRRSCSRRPALLLPFYWMVVASLKTNNDVFTIPITWLPDPVVWRNYLDIWQRSDMTTWLRNTLLLSVVVTVLQVLTGSFAAYGFARVRFPGRNLLFLAYVGTIAVPWQSYMIPQFILMSKLHLSNTLWSIVALQAFGAFGVFLMKQFYETIPEELSEAARIDGLSEFGIYRRIMLPLSRPALASLALLTFVTTWNDYLGPLIYLRSPELRTIQLGLHTFISPVQRRVRADHDGLRAVRAARRGHLPARPALLHRGHRHDRTEGLRPMRSRHDTIAAVFDGVYVALVTNLLLVLGCLPLVVARVHHRRGALLAAATRWPPRLRARALCGLRGHVRRTRPGGTGGRAPHLRPAPGGPPPGRRCSGRRQPWLPWSCSASTPRAAWGHRVGALALPVLATLIVLTVATTLLGLVTVAERPTARLRDVARACALPGGAPVVPHRRVAARARAARAAPRGPPRDRARPRRRAAALRRVGQQPLHACGPRSTHRRPQPGAPDHHALPATEPGRRRHTCPAPDRTHEGEQHP